jgi:hypothetical protein
MPRELVDTGTDQSADVGRGLAADRRQHARTTAWKGEGDRGDH